MHTYRYIVLALLKKYCSSQGYNIFEYMHSLFVYIGQNKALIYCDLATMLGNCHCTHCTVKLRQILFYVQDYFKPAAMIRHQLLIMMFYLLYISRKKAIRLKLSTISQLYCNKIFTNILQDKIWNKSL